MLGARQSDASKSDLRGHWAILSYNRGCTIAPSQWLRKSPLQEASFLTLNGESNPHAILPSQSYARRSLRVRVGSMQLLPESATMIMAHPGRLCERPRIRNLKPRKPGQVVRAAEDPKLEAKEAICPLGSVKYRDGFRKLAENLNMNAAPSMSKTITLYTAHNAPH